MSLAFLSKKSWHTTNFQNQRRVFEAEEAQKKREKLDAERQKTLEQERMYEASARMVAAHGNAYEDPNAVKKRGGALGFMYEAPPGMIADAPEPQRISNDDDGQASGVPEEGGAAQGGGGPDPRAIKPLGVQVRNVFCAKCKEWGHQMGDDECKLKALSVEQERFRQQIEDPLLLYDGSSGAAVTDRLVLRQAIDGVHGGNRGSSAAEQDILLSDDDEPPREKKGPTLSKEHKKAAKARLKELKKELKAQKKERKKAKKAQKEERRRNRTPSSSSSSSSSSPSPSRAVRERKGAAAFWESHGGSGGGGGGRDREAKTKRDKSEERQRSRPRSRARSRSRDRKDEPRARERSKSRSRGRERESGRSRDYGRSRR